MLRIVCNNKTMKTQITQQAINEDIPIHSSGTISVEQHTLIIKTLPDGTQERRETHTLIKNPNITSKNTPSEPVIIYQPNWMLSMVIAVVILLFSLTLALIISMV